MSRPRDTFFRYLSHHRVRLAIGVAAAASSAFAGVLTPRFVGGIFDDIAANAPFRQIMLLGGALVLAAAGESGFRALGRYTILNAARSIEAEMRGDLFGKLQRLELAYFQHHRTGDLMARMTNDLSAIRQMNSQGIMASTVTLMTFVFTFVSMLTVDVGLTFIAITLVPLASLTFMLIGRHVQRLFEKVQEQFGELASKAQENFSGIRVVKAFSQEQAEIDSFARATDEYAKRAVHLERFNGLMWPSMQFTIGFAVLLVLYVGGQRAIHGEMTIGQLVQFVGYLQLLTQPMVMFGEVMNTYQQGWASLRRLQELYDVPPAIADPEMPAAGAIRGEIEMRGVSFAYGPTTVLHDISFKLPVGGSLAIVGATGSGKSSLVNLVPRLFDVQSGQVLIDGVDVRSYPLRTLRRAIGYVPQETFLFSVPLRENVGFGIDDMLGDERLQWAGDVSQLNKDVADFPAGYDTMIGERGVTLSGGQKQRSAIARAVAKDPRVLVLDDALSAVDTYTEAEILRRLRGVMRERTSIIVAHRISTVKDADEILVLSDGRIAERGTHRELLDRGTIYAQMYRRQLLEEELQVDEEQEDHERRVRAERPTDETPAAPKPSHDVDDAGDLGGVA